MKHHVGHMSNIAAAYEFVVFNCVSISEADSFAHGPTSAMISKTPSSIAVCRDMGGRTMLIESCNLAEHMFILWWVKLNYVSVKLKHPHVACKANPDKNLLKS